MPVTIICPACGAKRKIKPSHKGIVFTCGSKKCISEYRWIKFCHELEARIQEPIKAALMRLYVIEQRSYRYICNLWKINNRSLMKLMCQHGVDPRKRSDAVRTQWIDNNKRRKRMGEIFGKINKTKIGPRNNNWRGGPIGGRHGMLEWEEYAETIRARDGFQCARCGITEKVHKKRYKGFSLSVHHVVPYKLSRDNSASNLKTLCIPCHQAAESEFKWLL